MPYIGPINGCKRPLPPPQSREAVLLQIEDADAWVTVDETEELQISRPQKRAKLGNKDHTRNPLPLRTLPMTTGTSVNLRVHQPAVSAGRDIPLTSSADKKKGLFSSHAYRQKVWEQNQSKQIDPINSFSFEDRAEDLASSAWTTTSAKRTLAPENTVNFTSDDGEEEAFHLAKMTNDGLISSDTETSDLLLGDTPAIHFRPSKNDIARERLEREGHEKSRRLRAQNLARRLGIRQGYGSSSVLETGQRPDENLTSASLNGGYSLASSSLTSSEWHTPLERSAQPSPKSRDQTTPDVAQVWKSAKLAANSHSGAWLQNEESAIIRKPLAVNLHPASRAAADHFRTQSRHLIEHGQKSQLSMQKSVSLDDRERRLREFTFQFFKQPPVQQSSGQAHLVDRSRQTTVTRSSSSSPVHDDTRSEVSPFTSSVQGSTLNQIPGISAGTQRLCNTTPKSQLRSSKSLSPFDGHMLQRIPVFNFPPLRPGETTDGPVEVTRKSSLPHSRLPDFVKFPKEPIDLTFPKNYEEYDEERKALVKETEIQRERERDLMVIIPTFEEISRYGVLKTLTDTEWDEVRELSDYTRAVVEQGLSGKLVRARILNIQTKMRRKVQRCSPDGEPDNGYLFSQLLKPERRDHVYQELNETRNRLDGLRISRNEATKRFHAEKYKIKSRHKTRARESGASQNQKKVRFAVGHDQRSTDEFAALSDGGEIELPGSNDHNQDNLTATERRRNAQYAAMDRKEAIIRQRLGMFDERPATSTSHHNERTHNVQHEDTASEISEEEDGADLFSVPVVSVPPVASSGPQAVHEGLLASMLQRQKQRNNVAHDDTRQPHTRSVSPAEEETTAEQGEYAEEDDEAVEEQEDEKDDDDDEVLNGRLSSSEAQENVEFETTYYNPRTIYTVYWEETKPQPHSNSRHQQDHPEHPASSAEDVKTTSAPSATQQIPLNALRYFSDVASANRHAKLVFMQWFMRLFPGRDNVETIERKDREVEGQLLDCGGLTAWVCEENVGVEGFRIWVEMKDVM